MRRLELVTDVAAELQAALADGDRTLNSDGDLQESRRRFERAYQLAEQADDVQAMAVAALGLAGLWVSERRTVTGSVLLEARLQHVLTRLDSNSSLALRIRAPGWRVRRIICVAGTQTSLRCSARHGRPTIPSPWPRH